jgi:hypothetical protein
VEEWSGVKRNGSGVEWCGAVERSGVERIGVQGIGVSGGANDDMSEWANECGREGVSEESESERKGSE